MSELTPPQRALLNELPTQCVQEYRPAQKLVALGLAVWATMSRLDITEAGRTERGDDEERCIACDVPFVFGDKVLNDSSGGLIHAACCGPERESYVNANGDPLGPDDPIPTGWAWKP